MLEIDVANVLFDSVSGAYLFFSTAVRDIFSLYFSNDIFQLIFWVIILELGCLFLLFVVTRIKESSGIFSGAFEGVKENSWSKAVESNMRRHDIRLARQENKRRRKEADERRKALDERRKELDRKREEREEKKKQDYEDGLGFARSFFTMNPEYRSINYRGNTYYNDNVQFLGKVVPWYEVRWGPYKKAVRSGFSKEDYHLFIEYLRNIDPENKLVVEYDESVKSFYEKLKEKKSENKD